MQKVELKEEIETLKVIAYQDNALSGECLSGFEKLKISDIPFHSLYHKKDKRFNLVKSSHYRRVVYVEWKDDFQEIDGEKTNASIDLKQAGCQRSIGIYIKQARIRGIKKLIGGLFVKPKSKQEWDLGGNLLTKDIGTAIPIIWAQGKLANEEFSNYLVLLALENVKSLFNSLKFSETLSLKRELLLESARFVRFVHNKGFYHDDLSINHILVETHSQNTSKNEGKFKFYLIDLDRGRFFKKVPFLRRIKNIFQVLRSFPEKVIGLSTTTRFLNEYFMIDRTTQNWWERKSKLKSIIFYLKIVSFLKMKKINFLKR